ncbi:MAG: glutathione S-transferase family protein [Rhizobiales bacterium]|nr:glutathione S-transferase family protein [Hyphomicrobiales bacterium]
MPLKLYYHPLASFCWKALIALYENAVPFEPILVDLGEERSRDAFLAVYPIGKFPVINHDGRIVPGSASIIEYLSLHFEDRAGLVPRDAEAALEARIQDRFYDAYVHEQMQKIVLDRLRPPGETDPAGVAAARAQIRTAYDVIENGMASRQWACGDAFTMADCAAAPALFYANKVEGLQARHDTVKAYLERLKARPSFARVLREAEPYFKFFPARDGDT